MKKNNKFIIVGAGPSGLSSAYELLKVDSDVVLFEKSTDIGGLSRTIKHGNCSYDIGPHRFFTLNKEVEKLYLEILGDKKIEVNRLTRILYNNKLFLYPLSPFNTLVKLGLFNAILIFFSYINSLIKKIFFKSKPKNFEDWVISNFGKQLYKTFFKSYTEKIWGISCNKISSQWAAQRIKNLSFTSVLINPIKKRFSKKKIKSLVDRFYYPKYGAGFFYELLSKKIINNNGIINLNYELISINIENEKVKSVSFKKDNEIYSFSADYYIFSCPFTKIIEIINPKVPEEIIQASQKLKYRNHICVNLEIQGSMFKDNWLYVHDPNLHMARVSNYKNFSKNMSNSDDINPLTVEYFCFDNQALWKMSDKELVELGEKELRLSGLIGENNKVNSGFVVRSQNAYPVINDGYEKYVNILKNYLNKYKNIIPIGRSGMFKYNNQDHAIATGIYSARNLIDANTNIDIWKINSEGIYLEEDVIDES